jgi:hypothetical protein
MSGRGSFKNISGQKFKSWTVIEFSHSENGYAVWVCKCECGTIKNMRTTYLKGTGAESCGCKRGKHKHTGDWGKSPTYRSWQNMIARCESPSCPSFNHYKQKGISVCGRWRHGEKGLSGFECFLADVGERPTSSHTLDRINNDLGYSPDNVRWATKIEQANNRETNKFYPYKGRLLTIAELARETGVSKELLRTRLVRSKLPWTAEGAVETKQLTKSKAGFYK